MESNNSSLVSIEGEDYNSSSLQSSTSIPLKNTFSSYDHGFTNGAYAIDKNPFEKYLDHYYEIEQTERLINHDKIKLRDYRNNLTAIDNRIDKLRNERVIVIADLARQQTLYNDAESWLKEIRQSIIALKDNLKTYLEEHPTDYKLFAAIMFLTFALIFMVADFGIATLVADAMGITSWEKYVYAAGLAGLSIMLKPVYDRLLEKHFVKNKRVKYYNAFVIGSAILVLILLISLGFFRMSTMEALRASAKVSTDISSSTNNSFRETSVTNPASSFVGQVSFILSSVIFAIASAICLGIALPVLHKERKQHRDKILNMKLDSRAKESELNVADLCRSLKLASSNLEKISEEIDMAYVEKERIDKYDKIVYSLEALYVRLFEQKAELSKALFQDGYLRGGRIAELKNGNIDWILKREIKRQKESEEEGITVDLENVTAIQDSNQQGELSRTRPYLALRKMIAKDFREKFNNGGEESVEIYG